LIFKEYCSLFTVLSEDVEPGAVVHADDKVIRSES